MILREVIEQLQALQVKYPTMGQVEIRDYDNPEYTIASIEYDEETGRAYIKFKECEEK